MQPTAETKGATNGTTVKQEASHRLFFSVRLLTVVLTFFMALLSTAFVANFNFTLVCMVKANNVSTNQTTPACERGTEEEGPKYSGEIPWSRETQGNLIAANSWGSTISTLPVGVLLFRFGAKHTLIFITVITALTNLMTPVTAIFVSSEWATFVIRLFSGFSIWSSLMFIISRWAPAHETGLLIAIATSGFPVGSMLANIFAGFFCGLSARGWIYAYAFWSGAGVVLAVLFTILFVDDPEKHRFISRDEMQHIVEYRKYRPGAQTKFKDVPWVKMVSLPVLACYIGNFTSWWVYFFVADFLPTYMKEVLNFNVQSNGLLSALPFLAQLLSRVPMGFLSDKVERRFGRTPSINVFATISFGVPALCFLGVSFLNCSYVPLAVALFVLAFCAYSATMGGHLKAISYVAPAYVVIISSVCMTLGSAAAVIVPYVVGSTTKNGTVSDWNTCFYISVGVIGAGCISFLLTSSGEVQTWAKA